ncbi:hypothetical protein AMECASPLE_001916 [Ameca splendens]|uniref:Uncharacterized protein n=1 Tax=Ameca splendens TaxID=208324 RepID=A0ABV0XB38_9TELE
MVCLSFRNGQTLNSGLSSLVTEVKEKKRPSSHPNILNEAVHWHRDRAQIPWSYGYSMDGCIILRNDHETGNNSQEEALFNPRE